MLIRYKKSYEKIAMGLLSFVPSEKDIKKLLETIKTYDTEEDWQLFLWRDEDIIGIIGVRLVEDKAELHHLSVNPSHREQGIGRKMIEALEQMYEGKYEIVGTDLTASFLEKCQEDGENG